MTPRKPEPIERLTYRAPEVARILGVSTATVYKWMDSGQLRSVVVGGVRLFRASDIRALAGEEGVPAGYRGSAVGVVERTEIEQAAYIVMFGERWRCVRQEARGDRTECRILLESPKR